MIRELAEQVIKQVTQTYPWLAYPAVVTAQITAVSESGERQSAEYYIKDVVTGERRLCQIEQPVFTYAVQVTDYNGRAIDKYPKIPNVKSAKTYKTGDLVTVALTGEEMYPVIIGGC